MNRFGLGLLRPDDLDRALKAGAELADASKAGNAREQRALPEGLLAWIEVGGERVILIVRRPALWDELGAVDPKPGPDDADHTVEHIVPIIMADAGMTNGGFYKHFGSKDALVAAAVRAAFDDMIAAMEARLGGSDALEGVWVI